MSLSTFTTVSSKISKYLLLCGIAAISLLLALPADSQDQKGGKQPKVDPKYKPWKWRPGTYEELNRPTAEAALAGPPQNFAVPLYSTAQFVSGRTSVNAFGKDTVVALQSGDQIAGVVQWYRAALKGGGWELQEAVPKPGGHSASMTGYKLGKYCRVYMQKSATGTDINVSLREK